VQVCRRDAEVDVLAYQTSLANSYLSMIVNTLLPVKIGKAQNTLARVKKVWQIVIPFRGN